MPGINWGPVGGVQSVATPPPQSYQSSQGAGKCSHNSNINKDHPA